MRSPFPSLHPKKWHDFPFDVQTWNMTMVQMKKLPFITSDLLLAFCNTDISTDIIINEARVTGILVAQFTVFDLPVLRDMNWSVITSGGKQQLDALRRELWMVFDACNIFATRVCSYRSENSHIIRILANSTFFPIWIWCSCAFQRDNFNSNLKLTTCRLVMTDLTLLHRQPNFFL